MIYKKIDMTSSGHGNVDFQQSQKNNKYKLNDWSCVIVKYKCVQLPKVHNTYIHTFFQIF